MCSYQIRMKRGSRLVDSWSDKGIGPRAIAVFGGLCVAAGEGKRFNRRVTGGGSYKLEHRVWPYYPGAIGIGPDLSFTPQSEPSLVTYAPIVPVPDWR